MPVDKIRYFPPLGCGITQKGGGEYFEDYPTFVYKADVGGFQEKKSGYIATWVKTAFVTQCCAYHQHNPEIFKHCVSASSMCKRFLDNKQTNRNSFILKLSDR